MAIQNRTNSIENPQTESTQVKIAKIRILFGGSLFYLTFWFSSVCGIYLPSKPNQTKPQHKKNTN